MTAAPFAAAASACVLLAIFLPGLYCYVKMFRRQYRSLDYALERCLARGDFPSDLLDRGWEEFSVPSGRGFDLHGSLLSAADPEAPLVILLHGIGWNRYEVFKYASVFLREGWSVAAFDLAGHGASEAPRRDFPSFGVFEKRDLGAVIAFLRSRLPKASALGLAGESLGAATALQYAAIAPQGSGEGGETLELPALSFVVADCSFSSMTEQCAHRLRVSGLPKFLHSPALSLASRLCSALRGFSLAEADPLRSIGSIRVPVLFIHGLADDFVPPSTSTAMHEALIRAGGDSELYLVPGAAHAKSYSTDPSVWEERVMDFVIRTLASGGSRGARAEDRISP